jgi:hypothetical protein
VSEVRHEPGVEVLTDLVRGMALEPRTISLEDAPNPELVDMKRRRDRERKRHAPL